MSTNLKTAEAFIEKLIADQSFKNKFTTQVDSPEAVVAFAQAEGFEFDQAQWQTACEAKLGDAVARDGSLSEEALAGVSGGFEDIVVSIFGITIGKVTDGRNAKNHGSIGG